MYGQTNEDVITIELAGIDREYVWMSRLASRLAKVIKKKVDEAIHYVRN